ncbi:hypothetical protein BDQ12DRAFT_128021 [Crucibulum laeve]|uniref:Uncharacterized protein n=1 Tax=Crucibulum laeve TaxID=68775 RepID=A0A5C3LZC3_9AGAR|nr:hypothetical protein BDQ12DRAFT_128021 [Crucibulum laeve]
MFAGRMAGGGTRSQIFGSRTYGSGYPNVAGRGVAGRGFPFYFWPLAWPLAIGAGAGIGGAAYLHSTDEYGLPSNNSRPGGSLMTATFSSNSGNTTFRVVSDNSTVASLIEDINANCTSYISGNHSTSPSPFPDSSSVDAPKPEQVVQYYRASSIALALEGYNNTATYADEGTLDSPLPNGVDSLLMDCMNQTIGLAAPLLDGANLCFVPSMGTMFLVWLLLRVGSVF